MYVFLVLLVLMALVTYLWSARGFYSALINMAVTIASAGVAFGVWEPTAYYLMGQLTDQWQLDAIWGVSLAVPFILSQIVLSVAMNALLRANVICDGVVNYVGGALCGFIAAFISIAIAYQSAMMIRAKADALGDPAVVADKATGSPVRESPMPVPINQWFVSAVRRLSETTLSTSTPMAMWRPHFADEPGLLKMSPNDLFLRYTYKPKDTTLRGRYTIGKGKQLPLKDLVGDNKAVKDINGDNVPSSSYVEGYVVQFNAGAREQAGQVIVGPGMFTLVMRYRTSEDVVTAQPFAMISQAKGDTLDMGRWRFDTPESYVASAGASADPVMAFEFLVPQNDLIPVALYIKGIRHTLLDESVDPAKETPASKQFASVGEHKSWFEGGGVLDFSGGSGQIITDGGGKIDTKKTETADLPLRATNAIGERFNKSYLNGLETDEKRQVIGGIATLDPTSLLTTGSDRSLLCENFAAGDGSIIIRVDAGPKSRWFFRGDKSEAATGGPRLQDTSGQFYECIGFFYRRNNDIKVRFTPDKPIKDKTELPSISKSDDTIKFYLVFRVSLGASISRYLIGANVIDDLEPAVKYDTPQTPR